MVVSFHLVRKLQEYFSKAWGFPTSSTLATNNYKNFFHLSFFMSHKTKEIKQILDSSNTFFLFSYWCVDLSELKILNGMFPCFDKPESSY